VNWTTASDLRAQVQRLWDKGDLLRPWVQGATTPPRRLRLVGPTSGELTERFDAVRTWMTDLGCNAPADTAPRWRIVMREFRHRVLGFNAVPDEIWLDTMDDALALIGKQKEAKRFARLVQLTREQHPSLLAWLEKRPLNALALAETWPRLLSVVSWLQAHPRPGIYVRQVDIAGVDSKFIEGNRGVLAELLDLALPAQDVDTSVGGVSQFCRRYGFKDKPLRIRFRWLDASAAILAHGVLPATGDKDITLTQADFAHLALPVSRVFITENEVNFLAFPAMADSMVIFGAGYGFEVLRGARWLQQCSVHYWGDIDTHGLAILDQLRSQLPHVQSLLMDHATLMAHAGQWTQEPQPSTREMTRLNAEELALYDELLHHRLAQRVRLEQECVGMAWLNAALQSLSTTIDVTPNIGRQPLNKK
jgi:hypothetical protein